MAVELKLYSILLWASGTASYKIFWEKIERVIKKMNLIDLKSELETLGFPVQYQAFAQGHAPELPYILFYEDDSEQFFADNSIIMTV